MTGITIVPPPSDASERLRMLVPFAQLDDEARADLARKVEWLQAPVGVRLFSVGDPPDGTYGIIAGRVRFFSEDDGHPTLTADAGPGVTFGEGSLLIGGGRSRTAVVSRDALLLRVPPDQFTTVMASPLVAAGVASLFAARFARPDPAAARPTRPTVVAVDAAVPHADRDWFVEHLRRSLGADVREGPAASAPANHHSARSAGCTILLVDRADPGAAQSIRQADVVVALRDGIRRPHELDQLRRWWSGLDPLAVPPTELVLLRWAGDAAVPETRAWRSAFDFADCHHVRRGVVDDAKRVGRMLAGTAIALVLGGGGARGMAHIGVLRALAELRIAVDRIGGSSMGAVIAGQAALGRSWQEMVQENESAWSRRPFHLDIVLPTVSVSSGRRPQRLFHQLFGDAAIEDFLVGYFCTSTNLSRFELAVHRSGPAAHWIRASANVPGLWPPVVDALGELHVDGGQLNNVPTDVMRRRHRGPIIAVDVCATQSAMTVGPGSRPPVGLRHVLRRRSPDRFPSLVETINRCALLGSLQQRAQAVEQADFYLTPDLRTIGFNGFSRLREAVEIGYRTAIDELSSVDWAPPTVG